MAKKQDGNQVNQSGQSLQSSVNQLLQSSQELFVICASCQSTLGKFTERPSSSKWADCKVEPVAPILQLVPGSSQVCPLCGEYLLLKNQVKPCEYCGSVLPVPPGGVLTSQGPLDEVIKRQQAFSFRPTHMILHPSVPELVGEQLAALAEEKD